MSQSSLLLLLVIVIVIVIVIIIIIMIMIMIMIMMDSNNFSLIDHVFPFRHPFLRSVQLRAATSAEVKRCCQQQALQDAQETGHWMVSKQFFPVQ
jgi:amino acid transporter